ncbi:rhamnulokinase family protein [Glaciihabitans sp. dw_435]|uniref:rhamnulokinase n=1 Tax=Glaciihabitans sp. dw_435 TaxID=2720081 RepID=UPI001BD327C0|nr:rhamnulokinase family protein [Glaciihabitans sp. dw_435]
MTGATPVAAVDLGATSGRVMLGYVGPTELRLQPIARFPNGPVHRDTGLHWDIDQLRSGVFGGLAVAASAEPGIRSIGVDAWAVDYALMAGGSMLGTPHHYRDDRNDAGVAAVHAQVTPAELYAANGLQHLSFNTLFQLEVDRAAGALDAADTFLLIPDLFAFWLTGRAIGERTNASTTGLLRVGAGDAAQWDDALIAKLGLPRHLFPELVSAGSTIGTLTPAMAAELGFAPDTAVTAVGSHDTASAVVAIPATGTDYAYISCGTWGLVGVELESPVLTEASRAANFTNEGGVDGRVRFLHNVMGLWLLSESLRVWGEAGLAADLPTLLDAASAVQTPVAIFDANDPTFLAPGDMPARIAEWCRGHGQPAPRSQAELVRSILESLADAFARAVETASVLSGTAVSVIHIVGGGSQNALLCQLTADRSGLPVLAGPVEATALGNVLVQARAQGLISGSLESLRSLVAATHPVVRYSPRTVGRRSASPRPSASRSGA